MATVAINDGNGMMAMPMMAESAMATAAIAQVEDDMKQSADRYDDVDYGSPPSSRSPTPSPRSSRSPAPSPRRDREASPALERRHRGRTVSEPARRQGRSGSVRSSRSPSRTPPPTPSRRRSRSPPHGGRHRREGLPCRGLSRHRRRRTWQSLPSLMDDGKDCHQWWEDCHH